MTTLTLTNFKELKEENKKNIIIVHNRQLVSNIDYKNEICLLDKNNDVSSIFNKYISMMLNSLMNGTKALFFVEDSWATSHEERLNENKRNTKDNFNFFFSSYSSTLASLEMINWLKDGNIIIDEDVEKKLLLIKQTFELNYTNFNEFYNNQKKLEKYSLKLLSIEEIKKNAEIIIEIYKNMNVMDFFEPKHRDYFRSKSPNFKYHPVYDEVFDETIVEFDNFLNKSIFSNKNIISILLTAYFETYVLFRENLRKDDEEKTFKMYYTKRKNEILSLQEKENPILVNDKNFYKNELEKLENSNGEEVFLNNKKYWQENGLRLHALINQMKLSIMKICGSFDSEKYKDTIQFSLDQNGFITSEWNNRKFYAFKDELVQNYSLGAYFGFSIKKEEEKTIEKLEKLLSENAALVREQIDEWNKDENIIPSTNFKNALSMMEEFNVDWVQKFFFDNKETKLVELV